MTAQQERKKHIRAFFVHYTDERLAALLAHAQDGKLSYLSCCCFIGVATADHALYGERSSEFLEHLNGFELISPEPHYDRAQELPGASAAEEAFAALVQNLACATQAQADTITRRILIPMIRAEMRRRDRLAGKFQMLSRAMELMRADGNDA